MVKCNLCSQKLGRITETHLLHKHGIHFSEFIRQFPETNIGAMPWNKGDTKETNPSLSRLSNTLGCFHEDKQNSTRIIEFKNNCVRLRKNVYNILLKLGFNPQLGTNYVRLARRSEVYRFKELIGFRNYN